MARYTKRPKAEADLLEIWLYVAQDSPRAADRLLDRIEVQCQLLADNPRLGRARPEIAPDARAWVMGRYLILYRTQDDGIEVVRVMHGARDIEPIEFRNASGIQTNGRAGRVVDPK